MDEDGIDKKIGYLYHENVLGQTPTEIAIQMYLDKLASNRVFQTPSIDIHPRSRSNKQVKHVKEEKKCFDLMVPFYLPRNQGNPSSKRVFIELSMASNMVHNKVGASEDDADATLEIELIRV